MCCKKSIVKDTENLNILERFDIKVYIGTCRKIHSIWKNWLRSEEIHENNFRSHSGGTLVPDPNNSTMNKTSVDLVEIPLGIGNKIFSKINKSRIAVII